ncbi:MAG: hypothetical protein N2Z84_01860 [Atribacterota bacterium]|nr:hypothetical protein [Atribacterota bacterium]
MILDKSKEKRDVERSIHCGVEKAISILEPSLKKIRETEKCNVSNREEDRGVTQIWE